MSKKGKQTPLMQQYYSLKAKHPNAILLFRVGDFYETFGEDAEKAAKILGIVLTSRNNGGSNVPLAGFPYHSLDAYLPKLIRAGFRVAICEQLEKPSREKKVVKRGVTEIVTPGVITDTQLLNHNANNYLVGLYMVQNNLYGIAFLDLSTGEFLVSQGDIRHIRKLFASFRPAEILYSRDVKEAFDKLFSDTYPSYQLDDWVFQFDFAREKLLGHFQSISLKGFGVEEMPHAQVAAGAILHYLELTENKNLKHIQRIQRISSEDYVWLDNFTIRNLELVDSVHSSGRSLFDILEQTKSPMGARLLRHWTLMPLKKADAINERLSAVEELKNRIETQIQLRTIFQQLGDIERWVSRISLAKILPKELRQLGDSLRRIPEIIDHLHPLQSSALKRIESQMHPCDDLAATIHNNLEENCSNNILKGNIIKSGVDQDLDSYRATIRNSKDILLQIQQNEIKRTGIANLKIGFNNVFGYYFEVTNKYKNQGLIPDDWVRKQTLTNSERYINDALKVEEDKILNAEEYAKELELKLYERLVHHCADYIESIQLNARLIARLDCICNFAFISEQYAYNRPVVNESLDLNIMNGRHPVIERHLPVDESYVPNDLSLDHDETQIMMITGPNMSGKSAYLRQSALIVLMAQMGCFVPAESAQIGVIDKVFTRVGASDNISSGESTFMVEMNETAGILNNISDRSLVLLDEIGRGTSTYDGISIAWAIAEYLHENEMATPKTLFATHYHELNQLANQYQRIQNFYISTREVNNRVLFLRKIRPGGSQHSFGIHVASMAGMPNKVIIRAQELLKMLEQKSVSETVYDNQAVEAALKNAPPSSWQLNIFEHNDPTAKAVLSKLESIELNTLTPLECMLELNELKKLLIQPTKEIS